jgi:hypothetical protein
MFDLWISGSRVAQSCGSNANYFSSIDECVLLAIASLTKFLTAYQNVVSCPGGVVSSNADLEAYRFCQYITGSLVIQFYDLSADFSVLYDLTSLDGLTIVMPSSEIHPCLWTHRVQGRSRF